ncbi:MAG: hypothetical protein KME30_27805 [Iphinoe sp. HA4291-MV1]|nr:hypothetical protein [Iphinoe sp. HA4291-MV1]
MKLQYLIASLIVGIITVSANYTDTHNLLLLQNTHQAVKTIKQNNLQAQVISKRKVPIRRESGGARSIKQAKSDGTQQHLIATAK